MSALFFSIVLMVSCEVDSFDPVESNDQSQTESMKTKSKGKTNSNLDLSILPGDSFTYGLVLGINNQGKIVGDGVWVDGSYTYLNNYLDGTNEYSEGNHINNQGNIVGFVTDFSTYFQAAYWEQYDNEPKILPTGNFHIGYAYWVNDEGQIVGFVEDFFTGLRRASLWDNDQLTVLPIGNYSRSVARAINNRGHIVGTVNSGSSRRPVTWINGEMQELPISTYSRGQANGINNNGGIVGAWSQVRVRWHCWCG